MSGKLVVIPFSYPFYPKEIIENQINESKKLLSSLSPIFLDTVFDRGDIDKVADSLRLEKPDLVVALLVSWIEAPNLIDTLREYFGKPLVLWSHTTIQLAGRKQTVGAFVAAGVIKQTLEDFDVPFTFVYGKPSDKGVLSEIKKVYCVSKTVNKLKDARIGLIGYPALGMYTGTLDHITVKKEFGPEIIHLDQYQLIHKVESLGEEEIARVNEDIKRNISFGEGVEEKDITLSSKLYFVLKSLIRENGLDAVTVKCQYEMSQIFKYTPCVALSLLGNELPASCEGDLLTILTELILHYLADDIVTYGDIHEVLEDKLLFGACGFAPFSMSNKKDCIICKWGWEAFGGVLNSSSLRRGKLTLARLSRDKEGFKMHVACGSAVGRSEWNEVDCPPYPGTDIALEGDTKRFAMELVSNHYAMVYADVKEELELFCKLLDIRYIFT